jgi:N-acetylmuramoyl-L-alanine amidase
VIGLFRGLAMLVHKLNIKFKNAALVVGFVILFLQTSTAWAGKSYSSKDLYYLAQKAYYKLKRSPDKQRFRHNWEKVIKQFSKVVKRYPTSQQAYKATFTIALLYKGLNGVSKNKKDLDQALKYYEKVYRGFSVGTLTDDALLGSAKIYRDKKDLSSALRILKKIIESYSSGDQVGKARLEYQKLVAVYSLNEKETIPQLDNNKSANLLQEKKVIIAKQMYPLKKTEALLPKASNPEVVKQTLSVQAKLQKKKEITAKSQVTEPTRKVVDKSPKGIAIVVSKVKPSTPTKKVFPKKRKKGGKGYLYAPSSDRGRNATPLIVVDAGHGGKDQGAKSRSGLYEKKVNLKIAKHVKTILVKRFKYRVVMTRKDDTFIPLKERSEIANNRKADLFVSIHANAAERKSAHGIETYFLGTTNNDRALETAARENGELVKSVNDDQVQEILASLITTTKINDSSRLAGTVQENLFKSTRKKFSELKNLGVKEGPFYVLHGADMPSILVEVGFLTNRRESHMLSKPDYLYRLASSIAEGIHKYLQDKGPSI